MEHFKDFSGAVLSCVVFGLIGIVLMMLGYKIFDWITPKIDVQAELAEKHNLAVGIVCAAFILGVAAVMVAAIIG